MANDVNLAHFLGDSLCNKSEARFFLMCTYSKARPYFIFEDKLIPIKLQGLLHCTSMGANAFVDCCVIYS